MQFDQEHFIVFVGIIRLRRAIYNWYSSYGAVLDAHHVLLYCRV